MSELQIEIVLDIRHKNNIYRLLTVPVFSQEIV